MENNIVEIFTDGACKGNPGPGGWAAVMRYKGATRDISGGERFTTNNRMEMMAAIMAMESLTRPCRVRITTDSQYLKLGITQWIHNWKKRGWLTASKAPVKNADLWKRLEAAASRHDVEWRWIRGHCDHPQNTKADALAREAITELNRSERKLPEPAGQRPEGSERESLGVMGEKRKDRLHR